MNAFVFEPKEENPNSFFWWIYMELVSILLLHIRSQRDRIWSLHLYSFRRVLPFFRYDHTHYPRWGRPTVYLAEINDLPAAVLEEFQQRDFVAKETDSKFNQVDPDHSQEWLSSTRKKWRHCGNNKNSCIEQMGSII